MLWGSKILRSSVRKPLPVCLRKRQVNTEPPSSTGLTTSLEDERSIKKEPRRLRLVKADGDQLDNPPMHKEKFLWFGIKEPTTYSLRRNSFKEWLTRNIEYYDERNQAFTSERQEILGKDIAAAYFILGRGGKIKFYDHDWTEKNPGLPESYDPHYILEGIDASFTNIYYEGLKNICTLKSLKYLSLRGCKHLDDWGLDRLSSQMPVLEELDISECENVTERGLEALYRMENLKRLVVTNYRRTAAFELTCFLLEDTMPGLECELKEPEEPTVEE